MKNIKSPRLRCLITAGPTREYFDPVRFISNPSSGKMGYALAKAALATGWEVDLISGPVALSAPDGVKLHRVVTCEEMFAVADKLFPDCDILIKTAAVCDMRPKHRGEAKVKKDQLSMTIEMEPTRDILKTLAASGRAEQYIVGFAAETNDVESYALKKLQEKKLDLIVANQVGGANGAFESDKNTVQIIDGKRSAKVIGPDNKEVVAEGIVDEIVRRMELFRS